jgi:hypothetical protein
VSSQSDGTAGKIGYFDANGSLMSGPNKASVELQQITIPFGIASGAITTGVWHYVPIPWACTISKYILTADQSGSLVIDIWKDTYANYPPTVADTITASAKPTLSSATKNNSTTLTGWTTSITAGDILGFNVDSCTTCTLAWLTLELTLT